MGYSLSDKLKYLRLNRNLTQTDVAKHLNMTRQGYSHYERGLRSPDNQTTLKLANFYQLNVEELINEDLLPLEIVPLLEDGQYDTNRNYSVAVDANKITIKVNTYEKKLISLFRKLDNKEQKSLLMELDSKTEDKG